MRYLLLAAFALFALGIAGSVAQACVQSVFCNEVACEVCVGGSCRALVYANLDNPPHTPKAAAVVVNQFQAFLDERTSLTSPLLPVDDPARGSNPAQDDFFWGTTDGEARDTVLDGATHLIARACEVCSADWDGTTFGLTIARPGSCP